ncbi:uncharacterized protein N7459_008042 [Penicillium hispanicum]|uniref:uncharacterized protein n=1 Tax=Penicillium hispanicum TaxID=1080232 RepID=UPI002541DE4C|nr:uncharacterized protein N7459_008042 [Penicillium hispanicum]KAJ5573615.1 hypothetical protein N7459_008042 [Penicillium hispanicum]
MSESAWGKTKRFSKKGFDKAWDTVDKLGAPVNRLSNKLGAEAFWPMAIDKESDKAARILRSFCKDGFYAPESNVTTDEHGKINRPKGKQRVIQKIPSQVIKNAKGLAIFTTMRTGLWVSGSGGSGVLLGRIPETGEWSPPSGIMLHTAGIGFLAGVDIYDCVVIINTHEALEAFKKLRCTIGGEVSAAAGPVGMGGVLESEVHKRQAPIWTYMKSKGLYAGVAIDGTIIIERTDENERFYGERIGVNDILAGKARHPPASIKTLHQTIKAAQGDLDVDESLVPPPGGTPGDMEIQADGNSFGVPAADDPDPYGVKALEAEGMYIKEAHSKVRPSHDTFEFRPNPSSPVFATFARRSLDSSPRNSWRASVQSYTSVDRGTQTDDAPLTVATSVSRASSRSAKEPTGVPALNPWEENDSSKWGPMSHGGMEEEEEKQPSEPAEYDANHAIEYDDDFEVHEVSSAAVTKQESRAESPISGDEPTTPNDSKRLSPNFTRARLVTIPKRPPPPPLPPRHPRHTWGSGSSRESISPTALSLSSHSTERTEAAIEPVEPSESINEPTSVPSTIKMLQTSTVLPAVEDEDESVDSETDLPADKDEFHSVNGDENESEGHTESPTLTEKVTAMEIAEAKNPTSAGSNAKFEAPGENEEEPKVEDALEELDHPSPKTKVEELDVDEPSADTKAEKQHITSLQAQAA